MKITNHFTNGTTSSTTAGVRVPYTVTTASAYATVQRVANRKESEERKSK